MPDMTDIEFMKYQQKRETIFNLLAEMSQEEIATLADDLADDEDLHSVVRMEALEE